MRLNPDYVRDILLFIEKELDYEDFESNTPHILEPLMARTRTS